MVPRFGFHAAFARSLRNDRATEVLNGLACIATRKPETVAAGLASVVGPGGLKYGASWGRSGSSAASLCTAPASGSVVQPDSAVNDTSAATASTTADGRRRLM